jgi:pilus assembly protein TadC
VSRLLPALLAGSAVLLWAPPRAADRLRRVLPRPGPPIPAAPGLSALRGPRTACVLAGVALVVVVGGPAGLVLGAGAGLVGRLLLRGLEPASERAARERLEADLPTALDLLAACLGGGASTVAAVRAVAEAVPGPAGTRFAQVGAALDVGAPPGEAWERLAVGEPDGLAAGAARALTRAAEGGAPVAEAVARRAELARAQARGRREQAAARAGVLAVAPLGLCFLPAFVLLGIVPVVVGLVGPVLGGL